VSCCKRSRERCRTRNALPWRTGSPTSPGIFFGDHTGSRSWRTSCERAKTIHCNGSFVGGYGRTDTIYDELIQEASRRLKPTRTRSGGLLELRARPQPAPGMQFFIKGSERTHKHARNPPGRPDSPHMLSPATLDGYTRPMMDKQKGDFVFECDGCGE